MCRSLSLSLLMINSTFTENTCRITDKAGDGSSVMQLIMAWIYPYSHDSLTKAVDDWCTTFSSPEENIAYIYIVFALYIFYIIILFHILIILWY